MFFATKTTINTNNINNINNIKMSFVVVPSLGKVSETLAG